MRESQKQKSLRIVEVPTTNSNRNPILYNMSQVAALFTVRSRACLSCSELHSFVISLDFEEKWKQENISGGLVDDFAHWHLQSPRIVLYCFTPHTRTSPECMNKQLNKQRRRDTDIHLNDVSLSGRAQRALPPSLHHITRRTQT